MAPIDLEGETLGERHRHYNKLVLEAVKQTTRPEKINANDADIENLMKIDIANCNKDLEYIMDVLRSNDMLYVSRVFRNGAWLMEQKYAHIFNAEYLHAELLPAMFAGAGSKLLLYIRTHMKDEQRADQFYLYYEDKNLKHAFKWLPSCSNSVVEHALEKYSYEAFILETDLIKRLCERSIHFLKEFVKYNIYSIFLHDILKSTMFFLNTDMESYLDVIDSTREVVYYGPKFGPKATRKIMKKCPHRILDNFEKYVIIVDLKTVADHMKPEDVKGFLMKHMANDEMKRRLDYEKLRFFVGRLPKEGRFEFIKKVFIDKELRLKGESGLEENMCYMSASTKSSRKRPQTSSTNVYTWYRFASFETAFPDLKKMIRAESSPLERKRILCVLLTCAGRNPQHIHDLLKFYQDHHINEPFNYKINFINQVVSKTDTHRYDPKTWDILNNIFHSLGVYIKSDNDVRSCVQSIIVYKTLRDEKISDLVEGKFEFSLRNLKPLQKKLSPEESKKVFGFLYRYLEKKLLSKNLSEKNEFTEAVDILEDLRNLLVDWKEELSNYPLIQAKATDLIKVMTEQGWTKEFRWLYDKNKWWRQQLFALSLTMCPTEDTLLNVIKHQPSLLEQHKEAVQELCHDDGAMLWRVLWRLRVYWPHSRAHDWTEAYRAGLTTAGGHRAVVRGLCTLLPPTDMLALLRHYAPLNTKIDWAVENEIILSVRKNLAQNMHRPRPPPPIEVALQYARGDYLQFAIAAMRQLAHNLNTLGVREVLPHLLDTPVSLRKHGLRLAFAKLPMQELKPIFTHNWNITKNSTLRAVLFKQTFNLLCRAKQPELIQDLWEMLSSFIDNLSPEENKEIYSTFSKVDDVPYEVRGQFCMKGYKFLKTLPAKVNCEAIIDNVVYQTRHIMEKLDYDFVINDLMPWINKKMATNTWSNYLDIISAFLLSAPNEQSQDLRYRTILVPLLQKSFDHWDQQYHKDVEDTLTSDVIGKLFETLYNDVTAYVLKKNMLIPVKLFAEIQKETENNLPVERNYCTLRQLKLAATWVKIMDQHKAVVALIKEEKEQTKALVQMSPEFSKCCLSYLKEDMSRFFPSVYVLFGNALQKMTSEMNLPRIVILEIHKNLPCEDFVPSYLVVIEIFTNTYFLTEEERDKRKEIQKMLSLHPSMEVKMHYHTKFKTD